jgi:hypothetical protein
MILILRIILRYSLVDSRFLKTACENFVKGGFSRFGLLIHYFLNPIATNFQNLSKNLDYLREYSKIATTVKSSPNITIETYKFTRILFAC